MRENGRCDVVMVGFGEALGRGGEELRPKVSSEASVAPPRSPKFLVTRAPSAFAPTPPIRAVIFAPRTTVS
jgi:hypothetical protein